MKTFISTVNKLSVSFDGAVIDLHPFYLVPDDMAEDVAKIKGMRAINKLFDVDKIQAISDDVTCDRVHIEDTAKKIDIVFEDVNNRLNTLSRLQGELDGLIMDVKVTQSNMLQALESAIVVANEIKNISFDGKAEAMKFKNEVDIKKSEITNTLSDLSSRVTQEMIKVVTEIETTYKTATEQLKDSLEQGKDMLQKYTFLAENSAQTAKKWAANPENIPVENGLFSAYHYAKLGTVFKKETV